MTTYSSMMSCTLAYVLSNPGTSVFISDRQFSLAAELQTTVPAWAEANGVTAIRHTDGYKILKEIK